MQVLSANTNYNVAMARQSFTDASATECPFQKLLEDAAKGALADWLKQATAATDSSGTDAGGATTTASDAATTSTDAAATDSAATSTDAASQAADGKKLQGKLNEMIAVGLIAPMLTETLGKFQQTYFANSPAEQAYAKQLYMEIATKIGQSTNLPLAKDIAKAVQQRLGTSGTVTG
jgi:hypothetical protein